ncbi:anaphase-promoting complex, cyclosome, subunit 4-domain-containing protein [Truncatella angustata]|uniref:Anaphase-promoting complex subunit 4 n=1 Tax=Truncatella angustata TaxID=152316 RepID=A0A9P8UZB1_9PEZI|nr:anaphase-promoting complex, cyclosome, subunit 4-domain-containing protein [Truncatella angustata]KAH6661346.1 anaphase-promoting complex, cyclosome, subunit 4-domain-containing protein [Truncatella angustata]
MAEPTTLQLLSETKLDPKPHGGLLTYNPSIELFARAAGSKTLQVWRSNGQSVIKSSQKGEKDSIQALRWKTDGEFLAVAWSDGVVRLMGLENSKAVHQIPVCDGVATKITCIGWTRNRAGKKAPAAAKSDSLWKDLSSVDGRSLGEKKQKPDLPRELAFLEVETALPKLSPLPASGGSGDDMYVFTTRASLEFLFRPFSPEAADMVDIMLVGTDNGHIHLSIYDSFVIGHFKYTVPQYDLPDGLHAAPSLKLTHHASHPALTTHSLLFQPSQEMKTNELYIVPVDLGFIYSSPENLSLLASKTTTLQKLLRYVKQVQTHMGFEWQSTRELPHKFLDSINETLKETGKYGGMDIGQAMYHTVVTGHTFPEVKEWLVDQLAERGHKRWDKAVVAGLEGLRSLVHENFLPALERIAILLSRLLGIARFHDSKDEIGFTSIHISKVMDVVTCLMLVGNKILLLVMEELELFQSFSTWLRYEIDRLASSTVSEELTEKEATMEHGKILTYISQYMPASPLRYYLSKVSEEDASRDTAATEDVASLLDTLGKHIKGQEDGKPHTTVVPQVEFLGALLLKKADVVFEGIAAAERRSVRFGTLQMIKLEHNVSKLDMRMCTIDKGSSNAVTYTALMEEEQEGSIHVFRTETIIVNGISGAVATQHSYLKLGDAKVLDLRFLNDESLLVLLLVDGKEAKRSFLPQCTNLVVEQLRLIKVPHQSADLGYQKYDPWVLEEPHELSTEQVTSIFPNVIVPGTNGFVPVRMEVKEASSERGHIPARVCLLSNDGHTYRVFALPENVF